eukprot:CAMPEP_0116127020 /NCGR_PEP_ID=MMETSP0329-20121206/6627_1 /TAXON_ID=697910 /ORGANISM="Pseudo-nitzschia arenysensis, Strain B593" /LENGTH=433 /DNA_ID=CAMNT_0003621111 /DNA_START=100 /DNA_END=1401 /DNA_ORIENTATION=+
MTRRLPEPLRWFVFLLLLIVSVAGLAETTTLKDRQCAATSYRHLVVLVHGYLGSDREQEYLGETLLNESSKLIDGGSDETCRSSRHELVILRSKANVKASTDGVAMGGKRLAAEVNEWIEQQKAEIKKSDPSTIMTFSLIGNSLGGLYGRYALAELDFFKSNDEQKNSIHPLIYCSTSSPHIGVSQETFIELPRWVEPHVATVFQQQTMDDLFGVNDSTIVRDMCLNPSPETSDDKNDYLYPLQQFQKRIAVANAYKTDFLVSVSSGAFLSLESDSTHIRQEADTSSTRLMRDMEHVALQVVTESAPTEVTESRDDDDDGEEKSKEATLGKCVDSLDKLGWHKIFIDTRTILPGFMNLETPELEHHKEYTSKDLKQHFEAHGTLFPIAHPLNMANSKTDLYRKMTQSGQPIVDALAELIVLDMFELSEKQQQS